MLLRAHIGNIMKRCIKIANQKIMIRITIGFLLLVLGFSYSIAQNQVNEYTPESATHFLSLPDGGKFIVDGVNKNGCKVIYINAAKIKVWEKPVSYEYNTAKTKSFALAAPDGNTFYFGEYNPKDFNNKKTYVNVFTREGLEKKYVVEGKEGFGKSLLSIFSDNNYMYFMASANGDELGKKMKTETVVLSRFSKDNFEYKEIKPELPTFENADKSTFWTIIGVNNGQLIFSSKMIDTEAGKNKFTIVNVNSEGKLIRKNVIETILKMGKFTRPSLTTQWGSWFSTELELDYFTIVNSHGMSGYNRVGVNDGAYGHILYDLKSDCFYVYGLFGPTPMKKMASVYEGFYVNKYDGNCSELWRLQEIGHKSLTGEAFFRIHATPGERSLALVPLPDNSLSLYIGFKELLFPYVISMEGKAKPLPKIQK